ncbi:MAG TPA: hypothetical protein VH678_06395 [Xanthobacteraceae bacterium]|jgi:hypothetical protein
MTAIRILAALTLLLTAASAASAAPRKPRYPQYPANDGWVWPRPYTTSPYSPSGGYRSPVPNDTRNSIEYELDMGAGSGRY